MKNHFAAKCHSVKTLTDDDADDQQVSQILNLTIRKAGTEYSKKLFAHLKNEVHTVEFQLDCGATVNVLSMRDYIDLTGDSNLKKLSNTTVKLSKYNKNIMQIVSAQE